MYPRQFIDSYWSTEIRKRPFIAMSFRDDFLKIFEQLIKPACLECFEESPLCVNYNMGGDSIINEILDGIAHCQLFIGEISTMRENDPSSRNGNVMWEVGIAHAFRQHEEVLLFRNDNDKLLFDIGQIRVHSYDSKNTSLAKETIKECIKDRLKLIEEKKSMLVDLALRSLNPGAFSALINSVSTDKNQPTFYIKPSMLNQQVWPKLFELGIVELSPEAINKETIKKSAEGDLSAFCQYRVTNFGKSVLERIWDQIKKHV